MRIRVSNGSNSLRNPDIKRLRECAIACDGVRHLVEDGRRFASANSKPGCQLKEVTPFDTFAEAADRCHMLSSQSRRSDKIIGGRHGPSTLGVHQESEILCMVVAVADRVVEGGTAKLFADIRCRGQSCGQSENMSVIKTRDSEVAFQKRGGRAHVDFAVSISVESLNAEPGAAACRE